MRISKVVAFVLDAHIAVQSIALCEEFHLVIAAIVTTLCQP